MVIQSNEVRPDSDAARPPVNKAIHLSFQYPHTPISCPDTHSCRFLQLPILYYRLLLLANAFSTPVAEREQRGSELRLKNGGRCV